MLNFHKSKTNSTINDMSTLSYQHNNLSKDGCMEMGVKVPGYLSRVYLNTSLFSQAFIDKVKSAKKEAKTDDTNAWWASRPISLNWESLVKDVTELNPDCEEIVSKAAMDNNLFFIISSLDNAISSGGSSLKSPITELHDDEHVGKSSAKSSEKYSTQDLCYVFAKFSDWKSSGTSKPSFPNKISISKICNNSSADVNELERKILVNYIQNFSEQWRCKTIIFESGKSNYGFDENGKKEASSNGAFKVVPDVCPTPKKPAVEIKPQKSSSATDITATLEKKEETKTPPSAVKTEDIKSDAKKSEVKKTDVKPDPDAKKETPKTEDSKETQVNEPPAVAKKSEAKKPASPVKETTEVKKPEVKKPATRVKETTEVKKPEVKKPATEVKETTEVK